MSVAFQRMGWALLLAASLAVPPVAAEHQKVVGGLVVNIGIVPSDKLSAFPGEAGHGSKLTPGSQHLVVSVSDATTGAHLEPAAVSVEVTNPKGGVERKRLVLGATAGVADHSEIFNFGWSGKYRIQVTVESKAGKRVRADFVWTHVV